MRRAVLAITIALILITAPILTVSAKDSISIPYNVFNKPSTEVTVYNLTQTYSAPWQAKIDLHLTFNMSTANTQVSIIFPANTSDGTPAIEIYLKSDGGIIVDYYAIGETSAVTIGTGSYDNDDGPMAEAIVEMASEYLNVKAYNATTGGYDYIVRKFAIDGYQISQIKAKGGENFVTAGYLTVIIDPTTFVDLGSTTDIIIQVVPAIAMVAVLGFIVGTIKKMTKR